MSGGAALARKDRQPSKAIKARDIQIQNLLTELQRVRPLSETEEVLLERTVRRLTPPREIWRWSEKEDRQIIALIKRRPIAMRYVRYGKPFHPNNEVRDLAKELGRTEMAVYRRMERLRKRMKCSNAKQERGA